MDLPRFVGNPWQYHIQTQREFEDFVAYNNSKNDCFWSHNSLPTKDTIVVRTIPFDFDDKENLAQPHADMHALFLVANLYGVPTMSVFSGKKGFHTYLCFKPMLAKNNVALKDFYKAVQLWFVEKAALKSWDKQLLGDTRRMMRIPGTIHPKTGKWCRRIDPRSPLPEILALEGRPGIPDFPEGNETLIEFCRRVGIKREMGRRANFALANFMPYDEASGNFGAYVKMVIPRMCIHNALMTQKPPHSARLEAIITLVQCGYNMAFAIDFMRKVSEHYDWNGRDPDIQNYFIGYQYQHPEYHNYSCKKLREDGLCIGKQCPLFERAFPEEVAA